MTELSWLRRLVLADDLQRPGYIQDIILGSGPERWHHSATLDRLQQAAARLGGFPLVEQAVERLPCVVAEACPGPYGTPQDMIGAVSLKPR